MKLIVQVSDAIARDLRSATPATQVCRDIMSTARQLGVELRPQHPDVDDDLLNPFFEISLAANMPAETVCQRFAEQDGVEAAYLKPDAELP